MNLIVGAIASSWILITIVFLLFVGSLVALFFSVGHRYRLIFFGVVAGILGLAWLGFATTFVVRPSSSTVAVYADGTVDPETFASGLHSKPLIGATFLEFDAQQNYQWCPEFTPSIKSGVEVKLTVCYRLDASKIAWRDQFLKWRKDQSGIMDAWRNEIAGYVALVVKDVSVSDLRDNRLDVARGILDKTGAWSETSGVQFSSAIISNWDFTNPDVGKQYDAQVSSSMRTEAVAAERQAAEQERTLQLYQAETYAQVLKSRAQADRGALIELGLPESQWSYYLINQRLMSFIEAAKTPNVVVSVGGQGQSPFVYPTSVITTTP